MVLLSRLFSYWGFIFIACHIVFLTCYACRESDKAPEYKYPPLDKMSSEQYLENIELKDLVSERDTICGMNLKEGIADTLHAGFELYGFCSRACKIKFESTIKVAL